MIVATENPANTRYSIVLIAGLSSLGTYQIVGKFGEDVLSYSPVILFPKGGEEAAFVAAEKDLSFELQ
jgi:hypothetical protein